MNKKYSVIETNQQGQQRLMIKTFTKYSAFEILSKLQIIHPENHYKIVKGGN